MKDKTPQNSENDEIDFVDIDEQIKQSDNMKTEISPTKKSDNNMDLPKIKKNDLQEQIVSLQQEQKRTHDRYLRALADYENLKKRTNAEKTRLLKNANFSMLIKLLDLADSFDKAKISFVDPSVDSEALKEGLRAIDQLFFKLLHDEGVERINCVGEKFNPAFHEAVFVRSEAGVEEDIILEEIQAGYLQNDILLRPSKVIIAKNITKGENKDG